MNILRKLKIYNYKGISIKKSKEGYTITNKTHRGKYILFPGIYNFKRGSTCSVNYQGKAIEGKPAELKFVSLKVRVMNSIKIGGNTSTMIQTRRNVIVLKVYPYSSVFISDISIKKNIDKISKIKSNFTADTLLITPGYPSEVNKYLFGFVHTRVLEYKHKNWNIDVASVSEEKDYVNYDYENINVNKISYFDIRNLLQEKKYKRIIVHFFKQEFAQILNATNTFDTEIFIFAHGADVVYRDINLLSCKYFEEPKKLTEKQEKEFIFKDGIIKKYNDMPNVKFIFPSIWLKNRSEEQNNLTYNNYEIIPTFIDEKTFTYEKKAESLRKNIVIIRKFDNIDTYGIDLDVKVIKELSKKPFFKDLTFNIYGDGNYYETLIAPIKDFENVHLHKTFLSHKEMRKIHKENGIALFGTRYETQGVSAAEAAMSGLVVITNEVAAVPEMFREFPNLMAPKNDYMKMVDMIEYYYNNPKEFTKTSKNLHDYINNNYNYSKIMKKELNVFDTPLKKKEYVFKKLPKKKILTIAIASYNVEKFLFNIVQSLLDSKYAEKLEILIINDGSKDKTAEIGEKLEELTKVGNDSIVKFVNKENGGHGSAINKGIELATGKYFKLMDGDDYFDTYVLDKLIEYLEESDEDIILNNYVEDLSADAKFNVISHYDFMEPGKTYNIDDLCYTGYGFGEWGPLLSTSTFKTEMLKKCNFKISEKCFYVDMELNSIAFVNSETIKYYPLDLYIYYLGRIGQSVSAASFKKNYKHHERVIFRILDDIYYKIPMSDEKKYYLKEKILIPLINTQYYITTDFFKSGKEFVEFDKRLKKYPEFYSNLRGLSRRIELYRKTNGHGMAIIKLLVKVKHLIVDRENYEKN